jgi:predicted nucleotidyltransferase
MLDEILLGKTRSAVLRETFINPDRRLSFNELTRRVKTGGGAVAREVRILLDAGLLVEQREGNQRFLAARQSSPVFQELKAFISKTSGLPAVLREALAELQGMIDVAFIFGSVARGRERADSDLDLFVIGTAGYSQVTEHLYPIEERIGRQVQVLYFDPTTPEDRASLQRSSMQAIVDGPRIFVFGDDSQLKGLLASGS